MRVAVGRTVAYLDSMKKRRREASKEKRENRRKLKLQRYRNEMTFSGEILRMGSHAG